MFLAIIGLILPPLSMLLIGILLILAPQHHAIKHRRELQRLLRPGNTACTSTGLTGIILSATQSHVILVCRDGRKHEILRSVIITITDCMAA